MATVDRRRLQVLTGPTAVGKTELALRWAERHDAEILSCDSLLFYRGMNIGTAKPTAGELARVPHHLIDVRAVDEPMDITDYVATARAAVAAIEARGHAVLITGGSGFYLKAFFGPVADEIRVPPDVRANVEALWQEQGLAVLVEELRERSGGDLVGLDVANPRRVVRALERCRVSGMSWRELQLAFAAQPGPFADHEVHCLRLEREADELNARIEARVHQMLADGLEAEVEALLEQGLRQNPSAARAIGYRETIAMLHGQLPRHQLADAIIRNTRALVRKQRTWFRTQLPEHRVMAAAAARPELLFA